MENIKSRKNNRLIDFDYSAAGAYFVTICAKDHKSIFGRIVVGDAALGVPHVQLSLYGEIVNDFINRIPIANPNVNVPHYIIMPNHIHLILEIVDADKGTPRAASPTTTTIPKIVNALKGLSTKKAGIPLWQRNYHDHIIRNQPAYDRIAQYIINNPITWQKDCYFNSNTEETT